MLATVSLSHLPFFEALAAEPDERSPAWRQLSAGLLALRAFDAWRRHVTRGEATFDPVLTVGVRLAIEDIEPSSTVRPVLLGLVDSLLQPGRAVDVTRGHLLAYARRLQLDASWRLAADVYRTFVATREADDVAPEVMEAAFQCGYCFRLAGELEEAAAAYDLGEGIAIAAGNMYGVRRARVCQAKLTAQRGNLPGAEEQLDAVIEAAEAAGCRRSLALALSDRMAVAGQRGQYEAAAVFGYRALEHCDDGLAREPVLADIATALGDAGHIAAARDAHLVLSETARDTRVRLQSTLNLFMLAVTDGDELAFERYRRQLADAPLPVRERAEYLFTVGDGHRRLGRLAQAGAAYEAALAHAEAHQVNEFIVKAEAALRALRTERPRARPTAPITAGVAISIDDVIVGMRQLRETAGAAAR